MVRTPRPPRGLRASIIEADGGPLVVLSHPIHAPGPSGLSAAEREVRELLVRGQSYAQIAELRQTSVHTVRKQVHALYAKLGVSSRRELVAAGGSYERS